VLQARFDAVGQGLDLGTGQAVVDVDPGDDPDPARADEGGQEQAT
jgi:hypothetical protein